MHISFTVSSTKRFQIHNIKDNVLEIVNKSDCQDGLCNIYTPHASSAIVVNEHYDEHFPQDLLDFFEKLAPQHNNYKHDNKEEEIDNTDAHIKASILGPSEIVPIQDGKLMLGEWQSIMFIDFDGPRKDRKIIVTIIGD